MYNTSPEHPNPGPGNAYWGQGIHKSRKILVLPCPDLLPGDQTHVRQESRRMPACSSEMTVTMSIETNRIDSFCPLNAFPRVQPVSTLSRRYSATDLRAFDQYGPSESPRPSSPIHLLPKNLAFANSNTILMYSRWPVLPGIFRCCVSMIQSSTSARR